MIPYAIPSFMTALVWRGMFNQQFGVINEWLGVNLNWLGGQWLPYLTILIVNLWLGYPYMFLVCTGALQGIPNDYVEAARVDGATGFKAFRKITFPLLLIAVAPLLIASFAFNFNNFNLIFLLTEGRPPVPGSDAGRTDILISYTYKLAFFGVTGPGLRVRRGGVGGRVHARRRDFGVQLPLHEGVRGGAMSTSTDDGIYSVGKYPATGMADAFFGHDEKQIRLRRRSFGRWFRETGWRHVVALSPSPSRSSRCSGSSRQHSPTAT